MFEPARLIVTMGVSGSGKSTVGAKLAARLGVEFIDGDDLHPAANKEKMHAGIPLTDEDRWPWLAIVAAAMKKSANEYGRVVAACSALRKSYRTFITAQAGEPVRFINLAGSKQLIFDRIKHRHHEFMPTSLLDSQYETLETPGPDENALTLDVALSLSELVDRAVKDARASG